MLPVAAAGCRLPLLLSAATVGCRGSALKEYCKGMKRAESSENQASCRGSALKKYCKGMKRADKTKT